MEKTNQKEEKETKKQEEVSKQENKEDETSKVKNTQILLSQYMQTFKNKNPKQMLYD